MEGLQERESLKNAGFTNEEIVQWESDTRLELSQAGFSTTEVDEYFGIKEPDMAPMQKWFKENLDAAKKEKETKSQTATTEKGPQQTPDHADTFLESIEAGWKMSLAPLPGSLLTRGEAPDVILPDDAPMHYRIASQMATLAGDFPAMVAGAVGGSVAGTAAAGPVGTVVGGGAGAFALPTAARKILMDHYEKGDIQDFQDFWSRASGTFIETAKAAVVGGATAGVGGLVGKFAPAVVGTAAGKVAATSSEIGTMVTVGKALEGETPNASDFVEAAVVVGALHGSVKTAKKLRSAYAEKGIKPADMIQEAQTNPVVRQELLSEIMPVIEGKIQAEGPINPTAKILEQVGEQVPKTKEPITFNEVYKNFVDKFDPIKVATEKLAKNEKIGTSENPYDLARLSVDHRSKVRHTVERGTLDFKTLETNGKGLKEILEPHRSEMPGLEAYIISKRAIEIEASGRKSGFDVEAAKTVVKEGKAKFEAASKEVVEFQNRNLKYLKDSGRISNETYKVLVEAGKSYIPFSRVFEAAEGGKPGKGSPLKRLQGSDKKIQNPLLSILENTETIYKIAEQNRSVEALVKLQEKNADTVLIEKVPGKSKAIEVSQKEMEAFFKEHGIEATPEAMTIFRGATHELAKNEFEVYRSGKREVYKSSEPALAESIRALEGDAAAKNVFFKLASGITTVKKLGITLTPDFILRNIFRDQLTAGVFGKVTPLDVISGFGAMIKKNDLYYNWLKSGGGNGAFIELNTKYLENNIYKLDKQTKFIDKAWNVVKKPVEILALTGTLADQATRVAAFKRVSKGASSGKDVFAGGMAAREITVDFQRIGAKMSAINSITAFQNVSIQGLDRTVRALKEDPAGVGMRAATYITLPSVLLWWANKDDPRYQEIPRWQKDLFWIIPTDNWQPATHEEVQGLPAHLIRESSGKQGTYEINKGVIYRLPKPQELGIAFGSLPERTLEAFFKDNPNAMRDFEDTMISLITPSLIPDAVAPPIEQYMNKSFFTDAPIIPHHMEGVLPEYQYTEYTTDSAKQLSKLIGVLPGTRYSSISSPMVVENYVRNWTGTTGMYALQLGDKMLQKSGLTPDPMKPASTLSDIPFIKAFAVRNPSTSSQSIQDFYERNKKLEIDLNTVKKLAKLGDFENMQKEMDFNAKRGVTTSLDGLKESLANQNSMIRMIYKNPDMKPEEKRQMIDMLYYMMIEEAKMGNQMLDELESTLKISNQKGDE